MNEAVTQAINTRATSNVNCDDSAAISSVFPSTSIISCSSAMLKPYADIKQIGRKAIMLAVKVFTKERLVT